MSEITANVDVAKLQEAANAAALKGAIQVIEEYYTGYSSPFKEGIEASLKKSGTSYNFELPDVVALINDTLSAEVDKIANLAIAQTYLPMVKQVLMRAEPKMLFSEFLKKIIDEFSLEYMEDVSIEVEEDDRHGWLSITLTVKDVEYKCTLHTFKFNYAAGEKKTYHFLSLPYSYHNSRHERSMKIEFEGGKIEMPFTPDILRNNLARIMAPLVLANTEITMDCNDFDEDMFPDSCHCH